MVPVEERGAENETKTVPQLKTGPLKDVVYRSLKISSLRNESHVNQLIYQAFFADCKSAYAGSIPTSASTLENPVD